MLDTLLLGLLLQGALFMAGAQICRDDTPIAQAESAAWVEGDETPIPPSSDLSVSHDGSNYPPTNQ